MTSLPNFNALLMQGFQTGRELTRQEGERNALAGVVNGKPEALGELATYSPELAYKVKADQDDRSLKQQKFQQERLEAGQKLVSQAALLVAQQPEAQRPAAWDAQIDALVNQGWTGMAQYKGKYSPQALQSVIAQGGQSSEYINQTKPTYMAIPEGGTLVNTRDPAAVAQFGQPQPPAPAVANPPPARPANLDDAALISQAREAIANGADATAVFKRLRAWGVQP